MRLKSAVLHMLQGSPNFISGEELAKRLGVSRQTINMIERGDYNPTLKLCIQLCHALGTTLDALFWEEETP